MIDEIVKIDRNIPLPTKAGRPVTALPFESAELLVGDSFLIKNINFVHANNRCQYYRHKTGRRYSVRSSGKDCRIWRVE